MRLSEQQVRDRFAKEVLGWGYHYHKTRAEDEDELSCSANIAEEFAIRLARDLQAPPTGEEVERAWEAWQGVRDAFDTGGVSRLAIVDDAVRAYGSACAAQARAEAPRPQQSEYLAPMEPKACARDSAQLAGLSNEALAELLAEASAKFGSVRVQNLLSEAAHRLSAIAAALDQLAAETGRR